MIVQPYTPRVRRFSAEAMLCLGHGLGAGAGASGMRWHVPDDDAHPLFMAPTSALAHSPGTAPPPVASPTFVGASAMVSTRTSSTLTPTVHASTTAGDIVLAQFSLTGSSSESWTPPSGQGWTLLFNIPEATGSPTLRTQIFWKRWGAGFTDDTTPTFTCSGFVAGASLHTGVLSTYRGTHVTTPFEASGSQTGLNVTTLTAPSAISAGSSRTVLRFYAAAPSVALSGFSGSPNTAYAGGAYHAANSADLSVASSWLDGYTSGSTGTGTVGGGGGSGSKYVAATLVLRPPDPASASDSVTTPTLASPSTNDILLAAVHRVGGGVLPSPPSGQGWNFLTGGTIITGTDAGLWVYWKRWGTGFVDDTTPTFTIPDAMNSPWGVVVTRWRRCRPIGNPYDDLGVSTGNGAILTAPSVNSAGSDRSVARFFLAVGSTSIGSFSSGDNAYSAVAYGASNGGISRAVAGCFTEDVGAGAVGSATAQTGANNWVAITVVLRPS